MIGYAGYIKRFRANFHSPKVVPNVAYPSYSLKCLPRFAFGDGEANPFAFRPLAPQHAPDATYASKTDNGAKNVEDENANEQEAADAGAALGGDEYRSAFLIHQACCEQNGEG